MVGSRSEMQVSRGPGPGSLLRLGSDLLLAPGPWQREAVSLLGVKLPELGLHTGRQETEWRRSVAEAQLGSGSR